MAGFHLLALLLWALHLYVYSLPATPTPLPGPNDAEAYWWGFWPITYAPGWAVAAGSILFIFTVISLWLRADATLLPNWVLPNGASLHKRMVSLLVILNLLLLLAFVTFPIAHTRWGDAYILSKAISWPDPAVRLTHSWQAPLDVFFHSQLWLRWHTLFGWQEATPVYRLLSPVAGLFYLLATSCLSLQRCFAPTWLTFGLLTTLGLLQLFFGYIENYSFAAASTLLYLWLGLGALAGKNSLGAAATLLAITNAFHPSTIVLIPSLLYVGWQLGLQAKQRNLSWQNYVYQLCMPMIVVGGATLLLMETGDHGLQALLTTDRPGGGDGHWFVPLWETTTRWEHYTMFSWPHLRDFLNEQILVAPIVLPGLFLLGLGWLIERFAPSQQDANHRAVASWGTTNRFLLIATLCYLLFTWIWNPDYGGQRDWDLFSLAALPATLLLAAGLTQWFASSRQLLSIALPLLMIQFFHTVAWVYQNTLPWTWPK